MKWIVIFIVFFLVACGGGSNNGQAGPGPDAIPISEGLVPPANVHTSKFHNSGIEYGCGRVQLQGIHALAGTITNFDGSVEDIIDEFYTKYQIRIGGKGVTKEKLQQFAGVIARLQALQSEGKVDASLPIRQINFYATNEEFDKVKPPRQEGGVFGLGGRKINYNAFINYNDWNIHMAPRAYNRDGAFIAGHELGHAISAYQGEGQPLRLLQHEESEKEANQYARLILDRKRTRS
jgi:hypothetical protein